MKIIIASFMKVKTRPSRFLCGLLAICAASLVGCRSGTQPGSMSHASVQIQGHSFAEIRQVMEPVFAENGYAQAGVSEDGMVFERPGSRRDALKWGGWSGAGVTMRVKVHAASTLNGGYLLTADVFAAQNSNDPFFRTESRVVMADPRSYQKLLDQVAKGLKQPINPKPQ